MQNRKKKFFEMRKAVRAKAHTIRRNVVLHRERVDAYVRLLYNSLLRAKVNVLFGGSEFYILCCRSGKKN